MTCVCVRCGARQSHLYLRYPHGSVLSVPCEACSSPGGGARAHESTTASSTRTPRPAKLAAIKQKQAADPYVENDGLVVFLDLLLVKPRAFRHLLFNRPMLDHEKLQSNSDHAAAKKKDADGIEFCPSIAVPDSVAWPRAVRSFIAVQLIDSFLRWYYLCAHLPATLLGSLATSSGPHPLLKNWVRSFHSRNILHSYLLVFTAVTAEACTFLVTVTTILSLYVAIRSRSRRSRATAMDQAATPVPFKPYLVINALLLANVSTLFLLSLVLLWQAGQNPTERTITKTSHHHHQPISASSFEMKMGLDSLAERLLNWQPDHVVRHLVAGLSSGVSLAVVLPRAPTMTTASILAGWASSALLRSYTLLPSSSGDGAALTAEGRLARPYFCPSDVY